MQWLAAKWLLITGELTVRTSSTVAVPAELVFQWSLCSVVKKVQLWYTYGELVQPGTGHGETGKRKKEMKM